MIFSFYTAPTEIHNFGAQNSAKVTARKMKKALSVYGEMLRLVRKLPKDSQPYYAKYIRENFVNYREIDSNDPNALADVFTRAYSHSCWVLKKYSVDQSAADKLKELCSF